MSGQELTVDDLTPGLRVTWEWPSGPTGDTARERGVRSVGRVVIKAELPRMACDVGVQTEDDPSWVVDPIQMIGKGRKIFAADGFAG